MFLWNLLAADVARRVAQHSAKHMDHLILQTMTIQDTGLEE